MFMPFKRIKALLIKIRRCDLPPCRRQRVGANPNQMGIIGMWVWVTENKMRFH